MKTFILIVAFIGGFIVVCNSIMGTFTVFKPVTVEQKIVKGILGSIGQNILYGIMGGIIFCFSGLMLIGPFLGDEYNNKTDFVSGINNDNSSWLWRVSELEEDFRKMERYQKYQPNDTLVGIVFKDNYLSEIPEIVWEMKTLKMIDLTNNKITELPKDLIYSLESLTKIILKGNPIDSIEVNQLRKEFNRISFEY